MLDKITVSCIVTVRTVTNDIHIDKENRHGGEYDAENRTKYDAVIIDL